MSRYEPVYYRIAGTHTNVGTSEETTLQLPQSGGNARSEVWLLVSFHYVRSGGTAGFYAPSVGQQQALLESILAFPTHLRQWVQPSMMSFPHPSLA